MDRSPTERRLAAILAADVAGYSRLMGADEEGTHAALKACRGEVIEPRVAAHRGRIVKTAGDGLLAEFASVVAATQCAVEIQREMAARNAALPEGRRIVLRIGINLGDVIADAGDIYGDGVNIAARLESIAPHGGVCLSDDAARQVRGKLDIALRHHGAQRLKNIAEPVGIWCWLPGAAAAAAGAEAAPGGGTDDRPSLAVLPFVNLGGDAEADYFVDGLTEDIITELSRVAGLFVIARNSAFAYKGKAMRAQEIGRELGVRYLVEGSVRRAGNRVRVTVQLVEAASGNQLWAERYDRELTDIFELQDAVAEAIVGTLPGRIEAADVLRVKRKRPDDMAAYDYLLRGKVLHHRATREDNRAALEALERAIALDPELAAAHAWKACVLGQAAAWGWTDDAAANYAEGAAAVARALAIEENNVEAHRILCEMYMIRRDWEKAEVHHERALAFNPNDPRLVAQHGELLTWLGRAPEAIEWLERSMRLDPYDANKRAHLLGRALHAARRYDEAAAAFRRVPSPAFRHCADLAASLAQAGRTGEAQEAAADVLRLKPDFTIQSYVVALPYRDPADRQHHREGLRKAGLPE